MVVGFDGPRVVVYREDDLIARLLESEAHAAATRKEVHGGRFFRFRRPLTPALGPRGVGMEGKAKGRFAFELYSVVDRRHFVSALGTG